jgi:hypothetical protein
MASDIVERWEVESENTPGKRYTLCKLVDETWTCSCPHWTRRIPRKNCKHIDYHLTLGAGRALTTDPLLMSLIKLNRKAVGVAQ